MFSLLFFLLLFFSAIVMAIPIESRWKMFTKSNFSAQQFLQVFRNWKVVLLGFHIELLWKSKVEGKKNRFITTWKVDVIVMNFYIVGIALTSYIFIVLTLLQLLYPPFSYFVVNVRNSTKQRLVFGTRVRLDKGII